MNNLAKETSVPMLGVDIHISLMLHWSQLIKTAGSIAELERKERIVLELFSMLEESLSHPDDVCELYKSKSKEGDVKYDIILTLSNKVSVQTLDVILTLESIDFEVLECIALNMEILNEYNDIQGQLAVMRHLAASACYGTISSEQLLDVERSLEFSYISPYTGYKISHQRLTLFRDMINRFSTSTKQGFGEKTEVLSAVNQYFTIPMNDSPIYTAGALIIGVKVNIDPTLSAGKVALLKALWCDFVDCLSIDLLDDEKTIPVFREAGKGDVATMVDTHTLLHEVSMNAETTIH